MRLKIISLFPSLLKVSSIRIKPLSLSSVYSKRLSSNIPIVKIMDKVNIESPVVESLVNQPQTEAQIKAQPETQTESTPIVGSPSNKRESGEGNNQPTSKTRKKHFDENRRYRIGGKEEGPRVKDENSEPRLPKRKVAIYMCFSGTGYQGMQQNPNAKTIEGDLFKALCLSGAISKDNSDDIKKVSFMRAARTDKGVSAGGQVVSLKMIVDIEGIVEKINSHLPDQIRVLGFSRVMRSFHAKNCCDSRMYEYLLPTYVFLPAEKVDVSLEWGDINIPVTTKEEIETKRKYRIDQETLSKVKEALQLYVGTRNYHNFTIKRSYKDKAANRFIKSFEASDPFICDGNEWISLKVHGQSFMIHQIRKMVAMMVMCIRSNTPLSVITQAFKENKCNIPKVPGLGLLLEKPIFEVYNVKALKGTETSPVEFEPFKDEIESFKHKFIYPTIYEEELENNVFEDFLKQVDYHPQYFNYLNPEGIIHPMVDRSAPIIDNESDGDDDDKE